LKSTKKKISNQNEMQDLISVNNEEDIKELRHTSVIAKEKLHNPKTDVTVAIEECYVNIYPMEEVE
jgi:hypothetical protein